MVDTYNDATWVVVVSYHEKGFWMGDLFQGEADTPDGYFTMSKTATRDDAIAKARQTWPGAEVQVADPCEACNGSGSEGEDFDPCEECQGEGVTFSTEFLSSNF